MVSHIIVLSDFIEEARAEGMELKEALVQAGLVRLRAVLVTEGLSQIEQVNDTEALRDTVQYAPGTRKMLSCVLAATPPGENPRGRRATHHAVEFGAIHATLPLDWAISPNPFAQTCDPANMQIILDQLIE